MRTHPMCNRSPQASLEGAMKRHLLIIGAGMLIVPGIIVAANSARAANEIKEPVGIERVDVNREVIPVDTAFAVPSAPLAERASLIPQLGMTASASANYQMTWFSVNSGGGPTASANYQTDLTIGQAAVGTTGSANYTVGQGFWYGVSDNTDCACDCHADPVCDGVRSNVQDVVVTIGVAFRGAAPIPDPNGACPYDATDMNCDTFTSVVDVVKVVNVAFRGANPATEFCNPCP